MSDFAKRAKDLSPAEKRALLEQALHKRDKTFRTFPLSYAQERLWFLDQWEPQNAAYNISSTLRLQGPLQVKALWRSINEVVRRHGVLRTLFLTREDQPVQVVVPHRQVPLFIVDLHGLSAKAQARQVQHLARQEGLRPFDLRYGPLLRTTLLRLHEEEHIFLLTMHHIISDGWSLGVFNRELVTLYEAFSQDQPFSLAELPIQYVDYVRWQRQRLQGEALQQHLAYWRKQLQGAPPFLALPTDRPRPVVQTFAGAMYHLTLSTELSACLRSLSQRENATLFMTLLAAFQILLARYSQQDDISVGTYIAGRTHFQTENLIGFFINNLVLRTDLSGDPSFRVLLQRVCQVAQGAYEHQDVPFEKLIQELQPERNPGYTPFFQVMLIHQNVPECELSLPGLTIQQLMIEGTRSNFDLSLWVTDASEERLMISFQYNTDLFDAATIERMAGHFQTLLQGVVADPDRCLSRLPLLSAAERQQVLRQGNTTAAPFAQDASLDQLFEAQAARTPDGVAVTFEERVLTYAELAHRAGQIARVLQREGVGPEVLVGICLERSLEMVISLFGVLKAGGGYVPLDPAYPGERLAFMIQQTNMSLLLTQSHLASRLPPSAVGKLLYLDTDWSAIAQADQPLLHHHHRASQVAYVIYTSGSTGTPKGVVVEHHALLNFTQAAARLFGIMPGDRMLQFASLSFDASAEEIYPCLVHGGTLVLRTEMMLQSPAHFWRTCRTWGVTVLDLPTAYWHELAAITDALAVPPDLRLVIIGGEQAQAERLAAWQQHVNPQIALLNTYGPTETTVVATAHGIRPAEIQEAGEATLIGEAIANVEVYVLDHWGQPVPIGVPGELYIGGDGVARSYLRQPALTAERFVPDPFSNQAGARLYRTGDVVRLLPSGLLEYRGRTDRQKKLRGFRIELGEIEAVLARHPGVHAAAVLLREDPPGDRRLVAYVVSQPAQKVSSHELRSFLQRHLPSYMLPTAFVQLDALPLTPNGKLDRRALPVPERRAGTRDDGWQGPRTPTEEVLAEIWQQVLQVEQVGRQDQFFELGGHSLLATQLVARVRELFRVELPLRTIFETPTLAALAAHISGQQQEPLALPPLVREPASGPSPLSYAQQRLWFLDQLQPESSAYTIAVALRFSGVLHLKAWYASLCAVIERQEALRTIFPAHEGRPAQVVLPSLTLLMPLIDLRQLPAAVREAVVTQLAQQEAQRPFDLARGPLIRTSVLRLDEQVQVVLLSLHHIISDGWSMGLLFQELAECYRASLQHEPPRLPELSIRYADYAQWQLGWLEGQADPSGQETSPLEQQLAYWRTHLEGAPPVLELPTDHPRPQEPTARGAHYRFTLPAELTVAVRQCCRQEQVTLFMLLLTAFGVVLARYSGQEELVVGTPIANRRAGPLEGIIGLFANTLALRLSLAGHPSGRALLKRVREVALGAYAHQDVPFERVVEALHPQRDLRHPPLFQVMFVLQNAPATEAALPEVLVEAVPVESGIARFDLTLTIQEHQQEIQGTLEYRRDLFEPETIARLAGHVQQVLAGMVAHPEQRVDRLPLLTEAEQQELTCNYGARVVFPQEQCLHERFEQQVSRSPEAIALVYEEQQLSYAEVNRRANHLARALQREGVGAETVVGLCLERSLDLVVGILGMLKAGGAYVPLDPDLPSQRLAFIVQDAAVTVVLTQQRQRERLAGQQATVICLETLWETMTEASAQNLGVRLRTENLAYVLYTSGSTGQPKGVLVSHGQVGRLFASTQEAFHFTARDCWMLFHAIAFDFSVWELWGALLYGGRLVVVPFWQSRSPEAFARLLVVQGVTVLNQTPSAFRHLVGVQESSLRAEELALRLIIFGGEALDQASVAAWVARQGEHTPELVNMYGITETTVHVTLAPLKGQAGWQEGRSLIGRPLPDLQLYLLDAAGHLVPRGVIGEIYVAGAGLARGYLGRAELTAQRFVPHPWSQEPGARLYRTGDLGRYRLDGQLEYVGRSDGQVKLRGHRIELGEIEAALRQHPRLTEAVVAVRETASGERQLVAYVVPVTGETLSPSEVRSFLRARLPGYMLPAMYVPLEALPLTANGKLDRRALPAPTGDRPVLEGVYVAPATAVEQRLAVIWQQVLGIEQVGLHDNFFELGGDSILSIQIVAKARAAGLPLTPRLLFQHQTIAQLVAALGAVSVEPPEQELVQGEMPLTPIQHWFFQQALAEPQHWNQAILLQAQKPLSPSSVSAALDALLLHHDALRLRAQPGPEGWQLRYADAETHALLTQIDLSNVPEAEQQSALTVAACSLQASLNLAQGPILRGALFEQGPDQPARLLLIIHHLAIDIVSWSILLADLHTAYEQLQHSQPIRLPPRTTSFQQWSHRLTEYAQSNLVRSQMPYWLAQTWDQVHPLPLDQPAERTANSEDSARSVIVALAVEETQALLSEAPKAYHTQINDILLTALVQAFADWTGHTSLLVHVEGHGREDILEGVDLSRTVGWCTSLIPLVLHTIDDEEPGDAIKRMKEQLRAIPQGGIGFGLLRYLSQDTTIREQLAALPQPEVAFNYAGRSASASSEEKTLFISVAGSVGPIHSPHGLRPHLIEIYGIVVKGQLHLEWTYSQNLHRQGTIEHVAHTYLEKLRALIQHCLSSEAGGYTPSDFPEAELSQAALETVIAKLAKVME